MQTSRLGRLLVLAVWLASCDSAPTESAPTESNHAECSVREVKTVRHGQPIDCMVFVCIEWGWKGGTAVPTTLFCD